MVLGDSISSGHGIPPESRWSILLNKRLKDKGYSYEVVNASISGDTTSGGLSRISSLLERHEPSILLLELGGNEGLRGMHPVSIHGNLAKIVEKAQTARVKVLLLGMRIPPNYGTRYAAAFEKVYQQLASQYQVPLVPFLLQGVAAQQPQLMQNDGIHPTSAAQGRILENVWPHLLPLLKSPDKPDIK